jgi:hypothetical protein
MTTRLQSVFVASALVTLPLAAFADRDAKRFDADLNGYNEVPTLSSSAKADFDAEINRAESEIDYKVTYSGFATPVQQAHLHLGKRAVNGGIMVFICSNLGNGHAALSGECRDGDRHVDREQRGRPGRAGDRPRGIRRGDRGHPRRRCLRQHPHPGVSDR